MIKQHGFSLKLLVFLISIFIILFVYGFKILPIFITQYQVSNAITFIKGKAGDSEATSASLTKDFFDRMIFEKVSEVKPEDVVIELSGNVAKVQVNYTHCAELSENSRFCVDYSHSDN